MNTTDQQTMELIEEEAMDATDDDDSSHDDGSNYDEAPNLMDVAMENEVTAQLVAAGVVGVAAAAAITSSKKKKRPHSFETNPSIRKRQQNRLLRKLRVRIRPGSQFSVGSEFSFDCSKRFTNTRHELDNRLSFWWQHLANQITFIKCLAPSRSRM